MLKRTYTKANTDSDADYDNKMLSTAHILIELKHSYIKQEPINDNKKIKSSNISETEIFIDKLSKLNTKVMRLEYTRFYANMIKVINTVMCEIRIMIKLDAPNYLIILSQLGNLNQVIALFCKFITKIRINRIIGINNTTIKLYIDSIRKNVQFLTNNNIYIKREISIKNSNNLYSSSIKILDYIIIILKNILVEINSDAYFNVNCIPISQSQIDIPLPLPLLIPAII